MLTAIMIGNKISGARKEKNLSQALLAQRLSVSSQAVGKWERGESMPDIITFHRIAEVLGVDLNYFSDDSRPASTDSASVESLNEQSNGSSSEKIEKKHNWNMSEGNWVDADFSGLKNLNEKFSASNMQRSLFKGSDLSGLFLKQNNVDSCDFSDSDLSSSHIKDSNIVNSIFQRCSLRGSDFSGSQIKGCDMSGADFSEAFIKSCSLLKNNMTSAVWDRTAFHSTSFADIVFDGIWKDCSFDSCSFTRVTFRNATLTDTFFKGKRLGRIRFVDCKVDKLTYAFLKNGKADLNGVSIITT